MPMVSKAPFSWRRAAVMTADGTAVLAALAAAFLLRFDFAPGPEYVRSLLETVPHFLAAYLTSSMFFGLYNGVYYYSSFSDILRVGRSSAVSGVLSAALVLFDRQGHYPRSVLLLQPILAFLLMCGIRVAIRMVKTRLKTLARAPAETRRVLLVGAGELGESLLRQLKKSPELGYQVVGFIDDDRAKWGMRIHDCPVFGGREKLAQIIERFSIDEIIISIATQRGAITRAIVETLRTVEPRPRLRTAPALEEMLDRSGAGVALRDVKPADLLNRSVVELDEPKIARLFERRCVLVTGAGGTIGAELCRQALRYHPEKLVLIENHATSLFYRERELREASRGTAIVPLLGDVRDQGFLDRAFKEHRPQVVLHAAAHKHVHQLEFNIPEGISNNVLGTYHVGKTAQRFGVETFLLISTDKAVNPTSVMGATKRGAELVVRNLSAEGSTRFVAVRFGNVLGSSGSVLKIFKEQIAAGGPVTVTHERATRYFMTVEEAVGLVLQAASMRKNGAIFVLKMGTPVRIMDMARDLIVLSGLEPGKDIEIKVMGLKQGEKLDEELAERPEGVVASEHPEIHLLEAENGLSDDFEERISELEILCRGTDVSAMMRKLEALVPSFKPAAAHQTAA